MRITYQRSDNKFLLIKYSRIQVRGLLKTNNFRKLPR